MSVIVGDSFDRANSASLGNADTGQTWTASVSEPGVSWSINSNKAKINISADPAAIGFAYIDSGVTNGTVKVDISAVGNSLAGVIFRCNSSGSEYLFAAYQTGNVLLGFGYSGGISGMFFAPATLGAGELAVQFNEDGTIKIFVDGAAVLATGSTTYATNTRVGIFGAGNSGNSDIELNDFEFISVPTYSDEISDTLIFSEVLSQRIKNQIFSDSITFTEDIQAKEKIYNLSLSDSLSFSETTKSSPFKFSRSDVFTFVEKINQPIYSGILTDLFLFSNSVRSQIKFNALGSFLLITETIEFNKLTQEFGDLLTFAEFLKPNLYRLSLTDNLNFIEYIDQPVTNTHNLSDSLTFTDDLSRHTFFINDSIIITDALDYGRGLVDQVIFDEEIDVSASKGLNDALIFSEYLCPSGIRTFALNDNFALNERLILRTSYPNNPNPGVGGPGGFDIPLTARKASKDTLAIAEHIRVIGGRIFSDCGWVDNVIKLRSVASSIIFGESIAVEVLTNVLLTEDGEMLVTEDDEAILLEA